MHHILHVYTLTIIVPATAAAPPININRDQSVGLCDTAAVLVELLTLCCHRASNDDGDCASHLLANMVDIWATCVIQ